MNETQEIKETDVIHKIRAVRKQVRPLYVSARGTLFLYLIVFVLLKKLILYPIGSRIWGWTLTLTPEQFIYEWNIINLVKNPLVLIIGLLLGFAYCLIQLWEIAGIYLCLEYYHQEKPVSFVRLFLLSIRQIRQVLHPRNYMILVFITLILPIVDIFNLTGLASSFQIPEYISDAIAASSFLTYGGLAVLIVLIVLTLPCFFAGYTFVLEQKSFIESCRKSRILTKKKRIRTIFRILLSDVLYSITCLIFPLLVIGGLAVLTILLREQAGVSIAASVIIVQVGEPVLTGLVSIFIKMKLHTFLLLYYHELKSNAEESADAGILLPEIPDRIQKKHRILAHMTGITYLLIFAVLGLSYAGLTIFITAAPEEASSFLNLSETFAHKGYSSQAPENTMDAFRLAVECEAADWIELDVRCTSDGVPIVIHDATLKKGCGKNVCVYDVTLEELQSYKIPYTFKDTYPDAIVPTLEEVLSTYGQDKYFLIEIKYDDRAPDLPAQILDLINKYGLHDRVKIHSGSYLALKKVKELDPDMPCGLIMAIGLGNYYDLPGIDFFSVEHSFVNSEVVTQIHLRSKQIYVWTVNEEESFEKVIYLGVDGVITDYPDLAYDRLHSNDVDIFNLLANSMNSENNSDNNGEIINTQDGD